MFGRRPDATLVRDAAPVRRFMPFISPRRNESLVYFAQEIDVERALSFVEEKNRSRRPDRPMTLFHLVLRAIARRLDERPRLNRFTAGGKLWQRDGIWLTFAAKKSFHDDAPIATVKRRFDSVETLDEMCDRLLDSIRISRGDKKTTADHEVDLLLRLPASIVHLVMRLVRFADSLGLLPRAMIDSDPMFTSVFVANLGSVGLEAAYHHLWDHGTCPIFCVVGRIHEGDDGRRKMTLKYSFDERIEDGFYAARSLDGLRELLECPEKL
ncbi:MAG TPA: hypothetical protein VK714_19715 [Myxococcota bacterium]|nr:hypothetical protein [Myxococcota bacterium]